MNKKFYALIFSILIVISFVAYASKRISASGSNQTTELRKSNLPKWEYCGISDENRSYSNEFGKTKTSKAIRYFEEAGVRTEIVDALSDKNENPGANALAKAIAKLGNEGWELIGKADFPTGAVGGEAIYFKRPKQ